MTYNEMTAEIEKTESTMDFLAELAQANPAKASEIDKRIFNLRHYVDGLERSRAFERRAKVRRYPFYINKGEHSAETIAGPFQSYRAAKGLLKQYDFKVWVSQVKI